MRHDHWIDNADSYICPVCGREVSNPGKLPGCKCPCGFVDEKDIQKEEITMPEYIDREALFQQRPFTVACGPANAYTEGYFDGVDDARVLINKMPALKLKVANKRKPSAWVWITEDIYQCRECGHTTRVDEVQELPIYDYCPYCGAPMQPQADGKGETP